MSADRSLTPGTTRVIEEMVVMLSEMEIHEVRVGDLARRAGVAIPTVYYTFSSLTDVIAEATVVMVYRFFVRFAHFMDDMNSALKTDDEAAFRCASRGFMDSCWSREANADVHRLAPLIAYFRQVAPEDVRLREVQAREVAGLVDVLRAAQEKEWICRDDDVSAFVIVHWTCILGQAFFWHPAFGALTAIDFSEGMGQLRYQTALRDDIRSMSVRRADTT